MVEKELCSIYDMLHKDMTEKEITKFIYALIDYKIKSNNINKKVNVLICNIEDAVEHFQNVNESVLQNAFVMGFELYFPIYYIQKAISTDNIGELIHNLGHELEHIYQNYHNIHDKDNYNIHYNYEIPFKLREVIIKNSNIKTYNKICDLTDDLIIYHYYKQYYTSDIEFQANTMATLFYGYTLKQYAKEQPSGERKDWLQKQSENIFTFQKSLNQEILSAFESIATNVTGIKMKTMLLTTLKYVDISEDARELVIRQYDICKDFGLDASFRKKFNILFQGKFFGTLNKKSLNKNIDNLLKVEKEKDRVNSDLSKIKIEDSKYIDVLSDTYRRTFNEDIVSKTPNYSNEEDIPPSLDDGGMD